MKINIENLENYIQDYKKENKYDYNKKPSKYLLENYINGYVNDDTLKLFKKIKINSDFTSGFYIHEQPSMTMPHNITIFNSIKNYPWCKITDRDFCNRKFYFPVASKFDKIELFTFNYTGNNLLDEKIEFNHNLNNTENNLKINPNNKISFTNDNFILKRYLNSQLDKNEFLTILSKKFNQDETIFIIKNFLIKFSFKYILETLKQHNYNLLKKENFDLLNYYLPAEITFLIEKIYLIFQFEAFINKNKNEDKDENKEINTKEFSNIISTINEIEKCITKNKINLLKNGINTIEIKKLLQKVKEKIE